ncbi:MAG: GNAT family N-acetyltransferase [Flavobacteriaceae bacterium]
MNTNSVKLLKQDDLEQIVRLTKQLNPDISIVELKNRQTKMFKFDTYHCFGFFVNGKLIGVSSGWITVRLYSDKQLEIDNVIIDNSLQSKGYGKLFMNEIEIWAKNNNCKTIELNTYVQNEKSHKFYFNQGFHILGFHFQKHL